MNINALLGNYFHILINHIHSLCSTLPESEISRSTNNTASTNGSRYACSGYGTVHVTGLVFNVECLHGLKKD